MIAQCLLAALVATATPVAARPDAEFWRRAMSFTNGTTPCGLSDSAPTVKAPKANPWSSISPADAKAVYDFVHAPETGLNLTASENTTLTGNYFWFIDTLNTNKSQILPYIDGNEAAPPKYARVVIFEGGKAQPVSQEYMVGPLLFSSDTTIQKYDFAFNGGKGGQPLLKAVMTEVADINVALFDGAYLGPADKDTNASKYALKGYVTNERFFATASELRAAFDAGELTSEFPQTRDQTIEIGGKRYKVDVEQQYVEYMGWSFYMAFTRTLGLQFYDIKFEGDRVLYELTLQEAAAQYAGFQPKAAGTVYHDTYYAFGTSSATLLEGFDCPFGSIMLNATFPEGPGNIEVHPDAICIFEADDGFPLARHRSGSGNAYGFANIASVKNTTLHARTVATVGKYDYLFDYAFHLDGSLQITARARVGARFGSRISQGTQGSFHGHVLTYKADFDVVGASNGLEVTELIVVNQTQPWYPELGGFEQMEYRTSNMATEAHNVHLSIQDSPFTRRSSSFLKSHLAVTQQHDTEVYANSWQNVNLAEAPQHDFLKFFDGESVDDTDTVMWFNLACTNHFTRAEGVPVTLYVEAVSSISFAPHNFNDRAQEGDLLDRRWIVPDADGVLAYDDYGVTLPTCQIELDEPAIKIEPWVTI
ncbi:copper amine oxidase [Lasiosphaeria ovina]|uniref:Amine oxidase n=1 Tax=Lasiosphaeria ovina TaxID=92902 RepID=A0AAE0N009_9PEZI|nr:copper amine oxidase [Lasiosphaeria ovina]